MHTGRLVVLLPPRLLCYLTQHFSLYRRLSKNTVWGALSEGEARCLMKMAAKSGNLGMFSKAKEAVLLMGKVNTTAIRDYDPGLR